MTPKLIFAKVTQILNLVRQLQAKQAQAVLAEVDFIVDAFDRGNSGGLGSYWSDPGSFSLFAQKARFTSGAGAVNDPVWNRISYFSSSVIIIEPHTSYMDALYGSRRIPRIQIAGACTYKTPLSSTEYTVEVGLFIPSSFVQNSKTCYIAARLYFLLGAATAEENAALFGGTLSGGATRVGLAGLSRTSSGALIDEVYPPLSGTDWYTSYEDYLSAGQNTIKVAVTASTLTFYINGLAVASTTNTCVGGNYVGLASDMASSLVGLAYNQGAPYIEYFKAWVNSIPEPSTHESGHGIYESGRRVFADGYHDSDGNYNPLAFD